MADLNRFQQRVIAAYCDGRRRIALRAGWGAGKSYALGWIARLAGERGNNVMWVTDTGPHIDTIIQPVARKLLEPCGWKYNGDQRVWRKNNVDIWLRSYFRPSTKAAESNSAEGSNVGQVLLDERVSRESIVETPAGPRRIGDLVAEGYRGLVLGFDHATCRPAWTPVLATMAYADERPSYRFEWGGARRGRLECTGNHPLWVSGFGYVPAAQVAASWSGVKLLRRFSSEATSPVRMTAARKIGELGDACDLTTGTSNFFADGVLVHNCQMWANDEPMRKLFGRSRIGPEPPGIVMAGLPIYNAWWEDAAKALGGAGAIVHGTSFDNQLLRQEWFDDAWDTLGEAEYRAMLLNEPRPPVGQVYDSWSPDAYPAGNVLRGWQPSREATTVLAVDFGRKHPCALVLQHAPELGAWVIVGEVNPREPFCKTPEFARQILELAWPRHLEDMLPPGLDPPFRFDDCVADPAGRQRQRNARTGEALDSDLQIMGEMPEVLGYENEQGIGFTPRILVGSGPGVADRLDPRSGITRVHMAFGKREILCEGRVWDRGKAAPGQAVTFAKAVLGYRYNQNGDPIRTENHDHPLDALRYWVRDDASGLWSAHPMDQRNIGITSSLVSNFDDPGMW